MLLAGVFLLHDTSIRSEVTLSYTLKFGNGQLILAHTS